jgi:hypothetical protein
MNSPEGLSIYPMTYWLVIAIIIASVYWSIRRIKDGTGIPMLAVIMTVAVWYVGDAYYNDYAASYVQIFDADVLDHAWLEVAWFLIVFTFTVPMFHNWFNAKYLRQSSGVLHLSRSGIGHQGFQRQLDILFKGSLIIYIILAVFATILLKSQIYYYFFPYMGYKAEPWGRARVGGGISFLLSFAEDIQTLVACVFGVLAAVSNNKRTLFLSLVLCFLSWPYYLFDRTRNTILAVIIPAVISFVFLRLRGNIWMKIIVLAVCYVLINGWMAFVIQNRSSESISQAFQQKGFNLGKESEVHHEGLNMFEELCWINTFFKKGTFAPNWGGDYFSELVNPVPRALWHGKPYIGIDYAIARGMGTRGNEGSAGDAGVDATISTGLIGQGVVNFSVILGPAAAAMLMSFWVVLLARQDLQIWDLGRLPLYAIGLILTFNMGRDITLIVLYPFVFGLVLLWIFGERKVTRYAFQPNVNTAQPQNQSEAKSKSTDVPIARRPGQFGLRRKRIHSRPNR